MKAKPNGPPCKRAGRLCFWPGTLIFRTTPSNLRRGRRSGRLALRRVPAQDPSATRQRPGIALHGIPFPLVDDGSGSSTLLSGRTIGRKYQPRSQAHGKGKPLCTTPARHPVAHIAACPGYGHAYRTSSPGQSSGAVRMPAIGVGLTLCLALMAMLWQSSPTTSRFWRSHRSSARPAPWLEAQRPRSAQAS